MMTGCGTLLPTRSTASRILLHGGRWCGCLVLIRHRHGPFASARSAFASASRIRAQERTPRRKLSSSYFSLGLWMRSSSSAKPASTTSMPSAFLSSCVTGIEPPPPMKKASRPHSAVSASRVLPKAGASIGKRIALPGAVLDELDRAVGSAGTPGEVAEGGADRVRILVEHQPERDLGRRLGRDHRLEALALIAAAHAVDLAGRTRPGHLEHRAAALAGGHREADGAEEGAFVERQLAHCARSAAGNSGTPS